MAGPTIFTGYLSDNIKITEDAPTVAGTSEVDSTALDMTGYDGVCFIARIGTAAANNTMKGQSDVAVGMGTVADLAGTNVIAGVTNKVLILDIERPTKQFVRCAILRGTSTTVDSIVAIQYKARSLPITQLVTTVTKVHEPADGTP